MKRTRILAIVVLILSPMANGAQKLTVNSQDVSSITIEMGQSCTVEVVSDDTTSYIDYVGFDNGLILGSFSHLQTNPAAGNQATVIEVNQPDFYGCYVRSSGITPGKPSPGIHFVFQYKVQQLGETSLKLYDETFTLLKDAVRITVIPAEVGTAFTYQGRLIDANKPADGLYDFQFKLYDSPDSNLYTQKGSTVKMDDLDVIDGHFAVELDFGSDVFDGDARWLEIGVRPGDLKDPNAYTTLSPGQEVTPTPYALQTRGIFTDQDGKVGIGTTGPTDKLDVAGHINSSESYKLDGATVLAANPRTNNTFVGHSAGYLNTTGHSNTFVGRFAGNSNTEGFYNTFLGTDAGCANRTGFTNTFLGADTGYSNTTGCSNTFSGYLAGQKNITGDRNTYSGSYAGVSNADGNDNTYSGSFAGFSNTTGSRNTYSGSYAGYSNTTGNGNVFIGYWAGFYETGSNKLYISNSGGNPLIYGDFLTGRVGINTTNPGSYTFYVNGTAFSTGGWQSSDLRFKENIETIDSPIDKIKDIRGIRFEWKTSEYKEKGLPDGKHYGFIAQQVEEVVPEVVKEGPDGDKAVSYNEIVPILTEAIKEQQKQIESLRSEVKRLQEAIQQNHLTNAEEVQK